MLDPDNGGLGQFKPSPPPLLVTLVPARVKAGKVKVRTEQLRSRRIASPRLFVVLRESQARTGQAVCQPQNTISWKLLRSADIVPQSIAISAYLLHIGLHVITFTYIWLSRMSIALSGIRSQPAEPNASWGGVGRWFGSNQHSRHA